MLTKSLAVRQHRRALCLVSKRYVHKAAEFDAGDPQERAEVLADILGGLFGDEALGLLDEPTNQEKDWNPDQPRDHGKFSSSPGGTATAKPTPKAPPKAVPSDQDVAAVLKDKTIVQRIAGLPKAVVRKTVDFSKGLYAKAEEKYGPRWAKAILATAIITMPTPFTLASVGAMSGLAHVWTKYVSGTQKAFADLSFDEVLEIAQDWISQLEALHPQKHLKKWDPNQHPRGRGGKFIPKGSPEAVAAAKDAIKASLKASRTPEAAQTLMDNLNILTIKQLHELKKEYGLSASGENRAALVAKLADRLGKGRAGEDAPTATGDDPSYAEWGRGERESRKEKPAEPVKEKPGKKKEKTKPQMLNRVILAKGGIDIDRLGSDWNVSEDFKQAGLAGRWGVLRKGGIGLDEMAENLAAEGHLIVPPDRNADDYLMEQLQGGARSLHDDMEREVADSYAEYMRAKEDAERYAEAGEIEEAARRSEEMGRTEGQEGEIGEDPGTLADEEGGSEVGDFEFGANEKPVPETAQASGVSEQEAAARKWTKNEDGTYTAPNGTVWRKAAAGGEISPVTGEPFKGGSLMPIHGRSVSREDAGVGGGGGSAVGRGGEREKPKRKPGLKKPRRQMATGLDGKLVEVPEGQQAIERIMGGHPLKFEDLPNPGHTRSVLGLTKKQTDDLRDIYASGAVSIPHGIVPPASVRTGVSSENWDIAEKYATWKAGQGGGAEPEGSKPAEPKADAGSKPGEGGDNPKIPDLMKQPRHAQHAEHAAKILDAFDKAQQSNYATLADVRRVSGLSRAEFDRAAVGLAQDGKISFGAEEGRGGKDPALEAAGIPGIGGTDNAATRMSRKVGPETAAKPSSKPTKQKEKPTKPAAKPTKSADMSQPKDLMAGHPLAGKTAKDIFDLIHHKKDSLVGYQIDNVDPFGLTKRTVPPDLQEAVYESVVMHPKMTGLFRPTVKEVVEDVRKKLPGASLIDIQTALAKDQRLSKGPFTQALITMGDDVRYGMPLGREMKYYLDVKSDVPGGGPAARRAARAAVEAKKKPTKRLSASVAKRQAERIRKVLR